MSDRGIAFLDIPRADRETFVLLPPLRSAALICRELAAAAVGLIARTRRDSGRVAEEYDRGYWTTVLKEQRWRSVPSLEQFLDPADHGWRTCKVENRFVRARHADYYRYRRRLLAAVLRQSAGNESELVEVGCGYGANLFGLALTGQWRRLVGLDVSAAGVAAGRQIAGHFGLSETIAFERLDLLARSGPAWELLHGRVAFSYYCFEQLPYDTEAALRNLIHAGVKRVIHIEPLAELLHWYLPKDLVNYAHIVRSDYQRTLLRTLRRMASDGEIRILNVRRLYCAPGIRHDPAVVTWEPAERSARAQEGEA